MLGGLDALEADTVSGAFVAAEDDEDVHSALERGLIERVGPDVGGKLRAGRSRNDQIATLLRLWWRDTARQVATGVLDVVDALLAQATRHPDVADARPHAPAARPGRCCWPTSSRRTRTRCCGTWNRLRDADRRASISPYGSGALAGSSLGLDPEAVAAELGFSGSVANSIDGTRVAGRGGRGGVRAGHGRGGPVPDRRRR